MLPGIGLNITLHTLCCYDTSILKGSLYYSPFFDEEMEIQRDSVTFPQQHIFVGRKASLYPGLFGFPQCGQPFLNVLFQ